MELLDRYLEAVRKHLPLERQDDIIAELRANLESQLEDKEAELGRPLNTAEAEAWLKEVGPPLQVAAQYRPMQYLIGPATFPTYWFVLRMALGWATAIYCIVTVIELATSHVDSGAVAGAVFRVPGVWMTTAAWVTLVFGLIEFAAARGAIKHPALVCLEPQWSPSMLPPVSQGKSGGKKQPSYAQAVAEVIVGFVLLVWLLLIPQNPYLLLGPGVGVVAALPYTLAPIWISFYWSAVGLSLLQLSWRCVRLARGQWREPRTTETVSMKALGLIPLAILILAPGREVLMLKHPDTDLAAFGSTLATTNLWIHRGCLIVLAIVLLQLTGHLIRLMIDTYKERLAQANRGPFTPSRHQ